MQKFRFTGSFIISFVLNLVLNLEWAVLAFVLFLLHKFVKLPLWPCLSALGIWAGGVLIITLVLYLIGPWGRGTEPAEPVNKNPYSAGAAVGATGSHALSGHATDEAGATGAAGGAEPAEPVNKNLYSAGAAGNVSRTLAVDAADGDAKAALDSAQKVQTARTGDASKPVQYKSALARAIMQPKTYSQTSALALQDQPQNGEGTK